MNPYTGETPITIGGTEYTLVLDWRALSKIKSLFSEKVWTDLKGADPEVLAEVLAIALNKKHPEVTKETILDASPPLVSVISALDKAVAAAYFGADGIPKKADSAPEGEDSSKKKT